MSTVSALPDELVETIKERLRRGDWTHVQIAEDLGISRHTIARIARISGLSQKRFMQLPREFRDRPERSTADLSWMDRGRCVGLLNFTDQEIAEQKQVCLSGEGCEVRFQCLQHGLSLPPELPDNRPKYGTVYGGLGPSELAKLRKLMREEAS